MFAKKLKKLRQEKGISQAGLADLLNLSQQAIGKWECGKATPDYETLKKIAIFFHVSTDYLLGNYIPDSGSEVSEDAALLELLFQNDPVMKKRIKNLHIDGSFNDGKKVCDLSPESIARIEDAIRVAFAIDGQKGRAVVEIDE